MRKIGLIFTFFILLSSFAYSDDFKYLGLSFGIKPIEAIDILGLYDYARLNDPWSEGRSISVTYSNRPFLPKGSADIVLSFFDDKLYSIQRYANYSETLERIIINAIESKYGMLSEKRNIDNYGYNRNVMVDNIEVKVTKYSKALVVSYTEKSLSLLEFEALNKASKKTNEDIKKGL